MHALVVIIHLIACFSLILIVLLQSGKGQSMGAMFGGGGGSQTLFGSSGASSFLTKATTALAVVFMLTSLTLAYVSKAGHESIMPVTQQEEQQEQQQDQPAPLTDDDTLP